MIKKILLSLGLIGFGLINFTNSYNTKFVDDVINGYYPNTTYTFDEDGNFYTTDGNDTKNVYYMGYNSSSWYTNTFAFIYYSENGLVLNGKFGYGNSSFITGNVDIFRISTYDDIPNLDRGDWAIGNSTWEDVKATGIGGHINAISYNSVSNGNSVNLCLRSVDLDLSVCFRCSNGVYYTDCLPSRSDYSIPDNTMFTFSDIDSSLLHLSNLVDNSGGGDSDNSFSGEIELSNDDIVSYYEESRGFNYNMCFVGTWDFTQSDGTFKQGNGDNIFSYFNWFYNLGTGNNATGYKLSDVGKFIDEMYGNYDIYFNYGNRYSNGDIAYIYKFDINTHILDWVDTGFNNPFDEYTYVYTFYPKTLHYYTDYWRLYYYGGDLSNYCYYKLNFNNSPQEDIYGNLDNDISQTVLNNIGDWKVVNTNLKPSQSGNIISVSEDWHGSPLDYFAVENGSGYEDFEAGTFFSDSFNRFKGVFGELNPSDFGFGYLPGYIITFLLAFILFRFLSH